MWETSDALENHPDIVAAWRKRQADDRRQQRKRKLVGSQAAAPIEVDPPTANGDAESKAAEPEDGAGEGARGHCEDPVVVGAAPAMPAPRVECQKKPRHDSAPMRATPEMPSPVAVEPTAARGGAKAHCKDLATVGAAPAMAAPEAVVSQPVQKKRVSFVAGLSDAPSRLVQRARRTECKSHCRSSCLPAHSPRSEAAPTSQQPPMAGGGDGTGGRREVPRRVYFATLMPPTNVALPMVAGERAPRLLAAAPLPHLTASAAVPAAPPSCPTLAVPVTSPPVHPMLAGSAASLSHSPAAVPITPPSHPTAHALSTEAAAPPPPTPVCWSLAPPTAAPTSPPASADALTGARAAAHRSDLNISGCPPAPANPTTPDPAVTPAAAVTPTPAITPWLSRLPR